MHVALVTPEFPPERHGGIGSYSSDLARGLSEAGHRVTVFLVTQTEGGECRFTDRQDEKCGARVVHACLGSPAWMRWRVGALWRRWRLRQLILREHRRAAFDVVETAEGGGMLAFGLPNRLPLVTTTHGTSQFFRSEMGLPPESRFEYALERHAMMRSKLLTPISRYVMERHLPFYRVSHLPKRLIYNSVDTELFSPDNRLPKEKGLIVFVNSIEERKGIFQLLQAMPSILAVHPHAQLLVIGRDVKQGGQGEPLSVQLNATLANDVRERVRFAGALDRQSGVLPALRRANVCCYPSHTEACPLGALEAMSVGTAVVHSKTGPGPELIDHGSSGFLCDPKDPRDIAECINAILADDGLAARLGSAARSRILQHFERRKWIEERVAAYREVQGL